ncbi:Midasin [Wickerhamomyces ciferrii]|uniref:Midasin n=1 Tax=Wickerhamomyces ciferrii (strain ATCC 14091 / BCRC 22168 / CBS 111 / JCM 3599 / NBRC 0793 / NRRL Y-1031 F-60-10) TaxID=1206466 RepID=K0KV35_WICCF|nr:Midasin [Wickerhamomyces ciferrii]CCH45269.1 Midasin [Wickerhamomyces ciferrii]
MNEYTASKPLGNKNKIKNKFTHNHFQEIPLYKLVTPFDNPKNQLVLSGNGDNDVEVRRRILRLEDFDAQVDITLFDLILSSPTEVKMGDNEVSYSQSPKFLMSTDFKKMVLENDGEEVLNINPSQLVTEVLITETKTMFIFKDDVKYGEKELQCRSILLYLGFNHNKNFLKVWNTLKRKQRLNDIGSFELKNMEFARKLSSYHYLNLCKILGNSNSQQGSRNNLSGKNFNSLNKNRPQGIKKPASRINLPKSAKEKSSNPIGISSPATPTRFYAPDLGSARLTRSVTRTEGGSNSPEPTSLRHPITIDDGLSVTRPRRANRGPREVFKPSLVYIFKDNSYYKIKNLDFQCLYKSQWINDTMIDFFIKYFAEQAIDQDRVKSEELHVFTTFFFSKLSDSINNYDNIKRWVSKIDFSSIKYIIVPINENLHWYCSIIVDFDKVLQKHDKHSICKIYVFDSLKQEHKNILKTFQNFIVNYAKDKFQIDVDPKRIELRTSPVPKQPNFNDCGVHVIYNVFIFLENPDRCLNFWNRPDHKTFELSQFFKRKDREEMRERLRKTLKQLQSEQAPREDDSENDEPEQVPDDDDDIVYIDAEEFHDGKNKNNDSTEATEDTQDNDQTPEAPRNQDKKDENEIDPDGKVNTEGKEDDEDSQEMTRKENDKNSASFTSKVGPNGASKSSTSKLSKEQTPVSDDNPDSYHEITQADYNKVGDEEISRVQEPKVKNNNDQERFFSSDDENENRKPKTMFTFNYSKDKSSQILRSSKDHDSIENSEDEGNENSKESNNLKSEQDLENIDTQEDAQKRDIHDESLIKIHSTEPLNSGSVTPQEITSTPIPETPVPEALTPEPSQHIKSDKPTSSPPVQFSQELIDEDEFSIASDQRKKEQTQDRDDDNDDVEMKETIINPEPGATTSNDGDQNYTTTRRRSKRVMGRIFGDDRGNDSDVEMVHDNEEDEDLKEKQNEKVPSEEDSINVDDLKTGIETVEENYPNLKENRLSGFRNISYIEDDGYSSSLSEVEELPAPEPTQEQLRAERLNRRLMKNKSKEPETPKSPINDDITKEKEVVELDGEPNRPANRRISQQGKKKPSAGSSKSDALEIEDDPQEVTASKPKKGKTGSKTKGRNQRAKPQTN